MPYDLALILLKISAMPLKLLIMLAITVASSQLVVAQVFSSADSIAKILMVHSAPWMPDGAGMNPMSRECAAALIRYRDIETLLEQSGPSQFTRMIYRDYGEHTPYRQLIPEKLLARLEERGTFPPDKIARLRTINRELPASRTSYYALFHGANDREPVGLYPSDQPLSGFRVVDGSSVLRYNGADALGDPSFRHGFEDVLASQGIILPERALEEETGQPAYVIEIGLTSFEREYENALAVLLGRFVRGYLDPHYNESLQRMQGRTDLIEQRGVMVYGAASRAHVRLYSRMGFQPFFHPRTGEPVQLGEEDLFLIHAPAHQLLEDFAGTTRYPYLRNATGAWDEGDEMASRQNNADYYASLHERAPKLWTDWDYKMASYRLSRLHRDLFYEDEQLVMAHPYFDSFLQTLQPASRPESFRGSRLMLFFQSYYQLAYAVYGVEREGMTLEEREQKLGYYRALLTSEDLETSYARFIAFQQQQPLQILEVLDPNGIRRFEREWRQQLENSSWLSTYLKWWFDERPWTPSR